MHMSKNFGYIRLIAKSISLPFIVLGVFLLLVQVVPAYVGRGWLMWIFIGAGLIWALDTLWNMLDDLREINIKMSEDSPSHAK